MELNSTDHGKSSAEATTTPPPDAERDQLTGWKEIASYLGKSVRTVQRWEIRYALPVHRVPGSADVVLASKVEIERWKRSEASLEIPDLDRAEAPGAQPEPVAHVRAARPWRRLTLLALAVLALALVFVHLARRGPGIIVAADEDDAALFADRSLALQWTAEEGQRAPTRQPDGFLVDPGFVAADSRGVVFTYVKGDARGRARPYAVAPLRPPPQSPRLRFAYVPHADARVSHWAGFVDNSAFVRKSEESIGYWVPQRGVALRLDRTSKAYVDSRAGIWIFAGGGPRLIGAEKRLNFQMEPGRRYDCTLEVDGWQVAATVSDGVRVDALVGTIDVPITADRVFVADAHDGLSSASPRGSYAMRFEDLTVRDALYKVGLALVTAGGSATAPSLAILSNRRVDALSLDPASLRASGASVLHDSSSQGYACRTSDVNSDGVYDLVCDFDRRATDAPAPLRELVLTGRTTYGRRVAGRLPLPGSRPR